MEILLPEHQADLRRSGLTDATISAAGLRSLSRDELAKVLGFSPPSSIETGLCFPYPGAQFVRAKLFPATTDAEGRSVKYLQGKGTPTRLYIPSRVDPLIADSTQTVYLVEGEKKALLAAQDGLCAIGLGGIWSWKTRGSDSLLSDFDRLNLTGRQVIIVPDSDFVTNSGVRLAVFRLSRALSKHGAVVKIKCLPMNGSKVGYDDYRAAQSLDSFNSLPEITTEDKVFDDLRPAVQSKRYFVRGAFLPRVLADDILAENDYLATPIDDAGKGVRLMGYHNGVYRGDEKGARTLVNEMLAAQSKPERLEATVAMLRENSKKSSDDLNTRALDLVNVKNGMLDWRTGRLLPHSPDYLSSFQIDAEHIPGAQSAIVDKFLTEVFPADALPLCEELLGYLLLPTTKYQLAFALVGDGANGKSTFLKMVEAFLGKEQVSFLSIQDCAENRFAAAGLQNMLANIYPDLPTRAIEDASTFKAIVSGDPIKAERKHQHPFDLRPVARLLFSANEMPRSKDRSPGYFRRWCIIPFPRKFEGTARDENLVGKLTTREAKSALLSRALVGLQRLERNKQFSACQSVMDETRAYRANCDSVYEFVMARLTKLDGASVAKQEAYNEYEAWCRDAGLAMPVGQRAFNTGLSQALGVKEGRDSAKQRVWRNVGWREEAEAAYEQNQLPAEPGLPYYSPTINEGPREVEEEKKNEPGLAGMPVTANSSFLAPTSSAAVQEETPEWLRESMDIINSFSEPVATQEPRQ